ncbi:hypothetical protein [Microbacterium sp. NPDC057650]|uniref:hypothetical protein n=1 Tax=unclassified Microbacterium TaxID=2609290 RepID=UPI00366D1619
MSAAAGERMPGAWQVTGTSSDAGWMPIPTGLDTDGAEAWVAANTAAMRTEWGEDWSPDAEQLIPAIIEAAPARRREEDSLAFLLWAGHRPLGVFVHVAIGTRSPGDALPGPGDGVLFESSGLGPGVLVPRTEQIGDAFVVGYDTVFAFAEDVVLIVSVEPTFQDLLGLVSPSVQLFMDSLELTGPDGTARRANTPALLEAQAVNTWVDSLARP